VTNKEKIEKLESLVLKLTKKVAKLEARVDAIEASKTNNSLEGHCHYVYKR
jgi:outer membrane murein-binding lipoprotein Lpp